MLTINLIGTPAVYLNGQPISRFRSAKLVALLAFLVVERQSGHSRASLADLLWPEQPDRDARRNLTQTLTRLRKALGDTEKRSAYFEIKRATIGLRAAAPLTCDLNDLQAELETVRQHGHEVVATCGSCYARLQQSAEISDSPFMAGFTVKDAITFDEWLLLQREQQHRQQLGLLFELAQGALHRRQWTVAQHAARRQIVLEPWREQAHRQLIEALARDGALDAAIAQFERCQKVMTDELGMGVSAETHALHKAILVGLPDNNIIAQVPTTTTPFVGREDAIATISESLLHSDYRLVTLLGQGGIGKTRLSIEVARRVAQTASQLEEVCFVELAGVGSAEHLPTAVANALGVMPSRNQTVTVQLLQRLRRQPTLLILDNFEQLVADDAAVDFVMQLLDKTSQTQLLVTSRAELGLIAEDIVELGGLPLPNSGATREVAASFDAIRLFVDRAKRLDKRFVLSAENTAQVIQICTMVEGLPLGIELATAGLRHETVAEIAENMAESLDHLTTSLRDIKQQHRSLRGVFDYSWALLSMAERDLLARLSVFRGGFDKAGVQAVALRYARALRQLRSQSLVRSVGVGRFDLHEVVRQFSAEKLAVNQPSIQSVAQQHSQLPNSTVNIILT